MGKMTIDKAETFCKFDPPSGPLAKHSSHLSSDVVVAMELIGPDAVNLWKELVGPSISQEAKSQAPNSLRAQIGTDDVRNAVHASCTSDVAVKEIDFFFGADSWPCTALFNNCTLC